MVGPSCCNGNCFARLQEGLVADDGQAAHFLAVALGIDDFPFAGNQLGRPRRPRWRS